MKKKIWKICMVAVVFVSLFTAGNPIRVHAHEEQNVDISDPHIILRGEANSNSIVNVGLTLSEEMKITSPSAIRLTFSITYEKGTFADADIQFVVSDALQKQVALTSAEYKNHELVIYLANTNALFTTAQKQMEEAISLGQIRCIEKDEAYAITITPMSLTYVYENQNQEVKQDVECAAFQLRNDIESTPNPDPEPTPDPEQPTKPLIPETSVAISSSLDVQMKDTTQAILKESVAKELAKDSYKNILENLPKGYALSTTIQFLPLSDADITKEVNRKMTQALADGVQVGAYYDINIAMQALSDNEVLAELNGVPLHETTDVLSFTYALPKDLQKENREFGILRLHDGKVEEVHSIMHTDGTITFTSDRFSIYALVYRDVDKKEDVITDSEHDRSPMVDTGAPISAILPMLTLACLCMSAILFVVRKKKQLQSKKV